MRDLRRATTSQLLLGPLAATGWSLGVLGLLESFYVAPFSLSAMWYGFAIYGLVGAAAGLAWGLLFGGQARRRDFGIIWLTGRAVAVPTFGLALAVAGFVVYRDLWAESVAEAGFGGWLAMLAVPVGAALLAVIARETGRALVDRTGGMAIVLVFLCGSGLLLGRVVEGSGVSTPDLEQSKGDSRAPVVVIVADALRADVLGAYGAGTQDSPNLDAFAREAVTFTEAWTSSTWTRPAVASIMTGQYAVVHKTMHKSDRLPAGLPTLAELVGREGYVSVASVTNVNLAPSFGLGRGFDAWGYLAPRPHLGAPSTARRMFLVEIYRLLRLRFFPGLREVATYYAEGERVTQQARDLIAPAWESGHPVFAYLHFMEPHDPYFAHPYDGHAIARVENPNPPKELAGEMADLYRQEVRHWDAMLGEFLAWLKRVGMYDRALIVVTSDHGEEFADHGHFWHGTSLYRELLRVPLLVRFPGGQGGGTFRAEPVSLVDLAPTVLAAAGVTPPESLPGQRLFPASPAAPAPLIAPDPAPIEGATDLADPAGAPLVITQERPPAPRAVFAELDHQGCVLKAARIGSWKLIHANPGNPRGIPEVELFELSSDPSERKNRVKAETAWAERLDAVLRTGPAAGGTSEVQSEQVDVDAETEEQLRSLGYTQ